jgi:hypothetical protein
MCLKKKKGVGYETSRFIEKSDDGQISKEEYYVSELYFRFWCLKLFSIFTF